MSSIHKMMQCCQEAAFQRPAQGAERRIRWVVILTVVMMVIEIFAGWLFHSMALLADGWHMSTSATETLREAKAFLKSCGITSTN